MKTFTYIDNNHYKFPVGAPKVFVVVKDTFLEAEKAFEKVMGFNVGKKSNIGCQISNFIIDI